MAREPKATRLPSPGDRRGGGDVVRPGPVGPRPPADEDRRVRDQVAHEDVPEARRRRRRRGCRRPSRRRRSARRGRSPGRSTRRSPPAPPGPVARLTRIVVLATRSRTKTFVTLSSSSGERLSASDANATKRPSPEIDGSARRAASAAAPAAPEARLTSVVAFVPTSRTKMLRPPGCPRPRGCSASDCRRPPGRRSAEMEGVVGELRRPGAPAAPVAREMRIDVVLGGERGRGQGRRRDGGQREADEPWPPHGVPLSPGRRPSAWRGAGRCPTGRSRGAGSGRWRCAPRPGRCAG